MHQIIQQTDEEKLAMYLKLSKEELAKMLIQSNKQLDNLISNQPFKPFQPNIEPAEFNYADRCLCNPKNGGSGICGCTMGSKITYMG